MKDEERMRRVLSPELGERLRRLSDEMLVVVLEAFREGRRAGATRARAEAVAHIDALLARLEADFDRLDPERSLGLSESYAGASPSPVAAAHFGGAGDALSQLRSRIQKEGAP